MFEEAQIAAKAPLQQSHGSSVMVVARPNAMLGFSSAPGKNSDSDYINTLLAGEDELQLIISELATDVHEDACNIDSGSSADSNGISPLWNLVQFDSPFQTPPQSSTGIEGNEAVVPNLSPSMAIDQPSLSHDQSAPVKDIFLTDSSYSPATPTLRQTPGSDNEFSMFGIEPRSLAFPDTTSSTSELNYDISTPQTVPKTPPKSRRRLDTSPKTSPSKQRVKRGSASKNTVPKPAMIDDEVARSEKSKQSARDCRRRKKMYIEGITKKAAELADAEKKRLNQIKELKAAIEKLERSAQEMGISV